LIGAKGSCPDWNFLEPLKKLKNRKGCEKPKRAVKNFFGFKLCGLLFQIRTP
jgi:hypothetical protein